MFLSESVAITLLRLSEVLLLISGILLVIGLIGEYRLPFWHPRIEFFELLVLIGCAGELLADGGVFVFSEHLQKIEHTQISDLATSAHTATVEAQSAHTLAQGASDAAGEAKTKADAADIAAGKAQMKSDAANQTAGQAKDKADAVGKKAEDLDRQLASANTQLAAVETKRAALEDALKTMEICSAPRVIPSWNLPNKGSSTDPLKPFVDRQVTIEFVLDVEARRAAFNIANSLAQAGWKIVRVSPAEDIDVGVEIQPYNAPSELDPVMSKASAVALLDSQREAEAKADKAAVALINFLQSYFWQARKGFAPREKGGRLINDPNIMPFGGLRIRVGLYPPVAFITPPGQKPWADFIAQHLKNDEDREKEYDKWAAESAKRLEERIKREHIPPERAGMLRADEKEDEARGKNWLVVGIQLWKEESKPCQAVKLPIFVGP